MRPEVSLMIYAFRRATKLCIRRNKGTIQPAGSLRRSQPCKDPETPAH
jgi:hypothetical protein